MVNCCLRTNPVLTFDVEASHIEFVHREHSGARLGIQYRLNPPSSSNHSPRHCLLALLHGGVYCADQHCFLLRFMRVTQLYLVLLSLLFLSCIWGCWRHTRTMFLVSLRCSAVTRLWLAFRQNPAQLLRLLLFH